MSSYGSCSEAVYSALENYRSYLNDAVHKSHCRSGGNEVEKKCCVEHQFLFVKDEKTAFLPCIDKTEDNGYHLRDDGCVCRSGDPHSESFYEKEVKSDVDDGTDY